MNYSFAIRRLFIRLGLVRKPSRPFVTTKAQALPSSAAGDKFFNDWKLLIG
ncbi:MAG: hypothetical protein QM669_05325 [Siphonobacter sp.]